MPRIMAMLVLAVLVAVGGPTLAAHAPRESGTVTSTDRATRTITLQEMGPWHGPGTALTDRTIAFTPSTRVQLVRRQPQAADGGWPGGYVESPLTEAQLRPRDFATVELARQRGPVVATSIEVVRDASP